MANRFRKQEIKNYQSKLCNRELKAVEAAIDNKEIEDSFEQALVVSAFDQAGVAFVGTEAQVVGFSSGKHVYELYVATDDPDGAAVSAPFQSASGLELKVAGNTGSGPDSLEVTNGITALSKAAHVVGSEDIFCSASVKIDDISSVAELFFGFRKVQPYQQDPDSYDEIASFNIGKDSDGQIEIHTIQGLPSAIALANSLKTVYAAHIADATDHTTLADAVNVVTAADASSSATLYLLVADLLTQYDAHEGDAELGAAWVYHAAQEGGDASLASTVAPTTIEEAITKLNDLKAKLNTHDADATTHGVGSRHQEATANASGATAEVDTTEDDWADGEEKELKIAVRKNGSVYFSLAGSEPTVTAGFKLSVGETIVPFVHVNAESADPGVSISSWKCGLGS